MLFIASCSSDKVSLDISDVDLDTPVHRLEVDLYNENANGEIDFQTFERLRSEHPKFFKLFLENIISVGRFEDSVSIYYLNRFLTDLQVREVFMVTLQTYPNIDEIEEELNLAMKRYHKIFPQKEIPSIYTYVSGFSYPMVVDTGILGIGLDFYLGSDKDYYRLLGIPAYKTKNLNRENIVADAVKSWLITEFELESENSDLLSHMIYHGKLLYAMDILLPETPDSIKLGYSEREMRWVGENEKDMWFHFAENELLYNKEGKQIQKYIGEAPFTPGFPEGSPGMTGRWVGWQIVRNYMKNTDPSDIQSLFNTTDAQKILKISKYKPT